LILWMRTRTPAPVKARVMAEGKAAPRNELPRPDETPASALWRRAEELAARGDYLEARRALYTAVLAPVHQRRWVRYEPTRTNGEYVEEVRRAAEVSPELNEPFARLTNPFEWKWYGERSCDDRDFAAGRDLAEQVRESGGT